LDTFAVLSQFTKVAPVCAYLVHSSEHLLIIPDEKCGEFLIHICSLSTYSTL
jgi:hypothetical protein